MNYYFQDNTILTLLLRMLALGLSAWVMIDSQVSFYSSKATDILRAAK